MEAATQREQSERYEVNSCKADPDTLAQYLNLSRSGDHCNTRSRLVDTVVENRTISCVTRHSDKSSLL